MSKVIEYGEEASKKVLNGIDAVADIVKTTLGPKGRNVLIRNQISPPIITNDGVTIAKSIQLKDNIEDAAAQLIIQAANKTNELAGDGTTTTTLLAQQMIHTYYDIAENEGKQVNPVAVQKDMLKTANKVSEFLKEMATPIDDTESIRRVATISSGNEETGKLIAEAFEKAGEYGSVIVEESKKDGTDSLDIIQGMKITNGSVSQYLLNDKIKLKTEMEDVSVLITTDKIDSVPDLFKVFEEVVPAGKKLLIICNDIEVEPLNMVVYNKTSGRLPNIGIIGLPGFGQLREELIEDICLATGATLLGREQGITLREFDMSYLGELEQVTISMEDTIMKFKDVSSTGVSLLEARQARVDELTYKIKNAESSEEKQPLERRISNLVSGIATILIGGNTQVEVEDKKLRIEDAINSVQAAIEEGIVPGGGYSYIKAFKAFVNPAIKNTVGENVIFYAMLSVLGQIAENSGKDKDAVLTHCLNEEEGYNALTDTFENLLETGVINAVKVDRYSLLNAASVASTVITMGGVVVEENEKDQNILQLQGPLPTMM